MSSTTDDKFLRYRYRFLLPDGTVRTINLAAKLPALQLELPEGQKTPDWARLGFHQCENCPLSEAETPNCPVAERLVEFCEKLAPILSTEILEVEVETVERRISHRTSAQHAKQSLFGLTMALSGCPNVALFKPLARFHLPFASLDETMFRIASSYLLARFSQTGGVKKMKSAMDDLNKEYEEVHKVNIGLANRLRASGVFTELNALSHLDAFTQVFPEALKDLEYLFIPPGSKIEH